MSDRYPQWKVDLFATRNAGRCCCDQGIPGIRPDRWSPICPVHRWPDDPEAADGRSIVENDAIQSERDAR